MWIKENFSREYHVVCSGKTNRSREKDLLGEINSKFLKFCASLLKMYVNFCFRKSGF